ncbi:MAG: asparagine synthase-related protein [Candidatus Omnitrophica bacterium]|nr:asparagine synthase-related protein [Candidatus Omnitrophota bacterium]
MKEQAIIKEIADTLREKLKAAALRQKAQGMLFSGGLDTSILAALSRETKAINVCFEDYSRDLPFAKAAAEFYKLDMRREKIRLDDALEAIPRLIKILKSFDPALPNDIAVYFGLSRFKQLGIKSVMTGDGADELFGGYSYMQDVEDLNLYIKRMRKKMTFNSNVLGDYFGIQIKQPFLDSEVVNFALSIDAGLKIREHKDKLYGKWILRKAFEKMLPEQITWQSKRPLEVGSGTSRMRNFIAEKITDDEFAGKRKEYPIKFFNKEHLYFYEVYKDTVGSIPKVSSGQKECDGCKAGILPQAVHCKVCGWVKL